MSDGLKRADSPGNGVAHKVRQSTMPMLAAGLSALKRLPPVVSLALVIIFLPLVMTPGYHDHLAVLIGINAVIAISLNLLAGYAGQISLGHAGFVGIGAYGTAVLASRFEWPPLLALTISAAAAGLLAFLLGRPILRLKGYYLAMATLGLGMIIFLVINTEVWLTGGPDGMSVPALELFGVVLADAQHWYWLVGAVLLLVFWMSQNLINAPVGRALRSLEGPEPVAGASGVDASWNKVRVFTLSAVLAAGMGGLSALYAGFISPKTADFMYSIELILMVILGGLGSVTGAVVGAAIITVLPQILVSLEHYEHLAYGVILVVVMIFMPKGVVPTVAAWCKRYW